MIKVSFVSSSSGPLMESAAAAASGPTNLERKFIEDIIAELSLIYAGSKSPDRFHRMIYDFFTRSHDDHDFVQNALKKENDVNRKKHNEYWKSVIDAISATGDRRGWKKDDTPAWTQFDKPYDKSLPRGGESFKIYLTFKRSSGSSSGRRLDIFFDNCRKLPLLLKHLHEADTVGKVSFKIASQFFFGLGHKDNVVIHFKNRDDVDKIRDAIQRTNFDLVDRESIGRTELGIDSADDSDSGVISKHLAKALVSDENKAKLMPLISQSKQSPAFNQAINAIYSALISAMKNANHRKGKL